MNQRGHYYTIAFFTLLTLFFMLWFQSREKRVAIVETRQKSIALNLDDAQTRQIFEDALPLFYPDPILAGRAQKEIEQAASKVYRRSAGKSVIQRTTLWELGGMYLKFVLVYLILLYLTFQAVLRLGLWRFVREEKERATFSVSFWRSLRRLGKENSAQNRIAAGQALGRLLIYAFGYIILFSPAYVLAYAFKSEFNHSTIPVMLALGLASNGLLILYSNKYYHLLAGESRKGYVRTALAKNYRSGYDEISLKAILRNRAQAWQGHLLQQILPNARNQYWLTVKEQGAYLITGLIIIEMGLNIQGHLCYQLLQEVYFENWARVALISWGLFMLLKMTDIFVDWRFQKSEAAKWHE